MKKERGKGVKESAIRAHALDHGSVTGALEKHLAELKQSVASQSWGCSNRQAESDALQNIQHRLDASHRNTTMRIRQLEAQVRQLRAQKAFRATSRRQRASARRTQWEHQEWFDTQPSGELTELAKQARAAEQRLERIQLWGREKLHILTAAHAERLELASNWCRVSQSQAERAIASMRSTLDETRDRLTQAQLALLKQRAQDAS